jgi:hypothetical protein
VPKVPVHDMVIHPRENDLVIATHGRGILIIDDITPIRHLTSEGLEKELFFLHSRPYKISSMGNVQDFRGDDEFAGRNPADAVYITYHLGKRHVFGDMYIEIYNKEGEFLKKLPAGTRKGINRVLWTPREKAPKVPPAPNLAFGAIYGPNYMPGDYKVRIVKGNETFEGEVSLIFDPNLPHSDSDRQIQMETLMKSFRMLEDLAYLDASIKEVTAKVKDYAKDVKGIQQKKLNEYAAKMEEFSKTLAATKVGDITGEVQLREKISDIYGAVQGYLGRPTDSQINRLVVLQRELEGKKKEGDTFLGTELASINKIVNKAGKEEIKPMTLEMFRKGEEE